MRYELSQLNDLDDEVREKLSALSLDTGMMNSIASEPTIEHRPVSVAYTEAGEPIGWATILETGLKTIGAERRKSAYIGVYVHQDYRRLGVGTKLVKELFKLLKREYEYIVVSPHDEKSHHFFKNHDIDSWEDRSKYFDTGNYKQGLIKLKEIIYESKESFFVLGRVSEDGEVDKYEFRDTITDVHPSSWRSSHYKLWRYWNVTKIVYWWESPTDVEKEGVEYFLGRKGYDIQGNKYMIHMTPDFNKLSGHKVMETKLNEGKKEKAAEDFIRNIIKGTEWEGKVFIAGGYVRDEFMGKDPKDLDLLVNAPNGGIEFANWITKKIGAHSDGNPVTFPRFGTAKFNLRGVIHDGIDLSGMDIEAVMPRKEQYTAGSRKPDVTGGDLKDDVERRDFTVNSLLKDLSSGEILDLTGMGKDDIRKGIVRTPLNPDKIFTDDPLRMLRAVRFAMKYKWKLPMFMLRGLKKNAEQLKNISQERIRDELDKMLMTSNPHGAIKLMKVVGLLKYVIPELQAAIKMTQNVHHKDDVFDHILDVLSKSNPVLVQRLMALFHDIGKTVTKSVTPTGVHFYGHEMAGADMVETIMTRLKYPRELIDAVKLGVRNHMRLKSAGDTGVNISDKALRKFKTEIGDELENVLSVIHADNIAHADASSMPNQINNLKKRLDNLNMNVSAQGKPKLPISGKDLQDIGLKPGPIYSEIMKAVTESWFENPNITKEQAIQIAKSMAGI